jgi:thiamine transporter ThiT
MFNFFCFVLETRFFSKLPELKSLSAVLAYFFSLVLRYNFDYSWGFSCFSASKPGGEIQLLFAFSTNFKIVLIALVFSFVCSP